MTTVAGVPAAEYRFTVPGGAWDATDSGIYLVRLRDGEIADNQGLYRGTVPPTC